MIFFVDSFVLCSFFDVEHQISGDFVYELDVRTRNWMEMNSLLVCFIESNLTTLNDHQVQLLSSLLESHSDVVLYPWLAGKAPLPSEMLKNEMMIMLLRYVNPQHPSLKMNEIP